MDLQLLNFNTHVQYGHPAIFHFFLLTQSLAPPSPSSSVLLLIFQGDTGATQGQVQVEGVPQQPVEGAVGGGEGGVSLEAAVGQLTHSLRGLLDQLRVVLERPVNDDDEREQDSDDDDR